jgi:Flp pilus assembly pilin Flp
MTAGCPFKVFVARRRLARDERGAARNETGLMAENVSQSMT